MTFLLLIYEGEHRFNTLEPAALNAELAEYREFGKQFSAAIKGGHALQPTATAKTVRLRNNQVSVTDGPFAETKEQLGGYYLIEATTIDDAARIAAKIPGARYGSIEVRPIMTFA